MKFERIFDFNPLDGVEWGVEAGEVFYGRVGQNETKGTFVGFRNSTTGQLLENYIIAYQEVLINESHWNGNEWVQHRTNYTVGCANELYPILNATDLTICGVPQGTTGAKGEPLMNHHFHDHPEIKVEYGDDWCRITNETNKGFLYCEFFPNGFTKFIQLTAFEGFEHYTGLVDYGGGKSFLMYFKFGEVLNGFYDFEIEPYGTDDFTIDVNISVLEDTLLTYASTNMNPTNTTLDDGQLFIDLFLNESNLNAPINASIVDILSKYENMRAWWFNESANIGRGAWEKVNITRIGNEFLISVNHTSIFAFTADVKEPPDLGGNPNWNWNLDFNFPELEEPTPADEIPLAMILLLVGGIGGALAIIGIAMYLRRK